jgi:predicted aldo/keto reductase-like oxidoreductase
MPTWLVNSHADMDRCLDEQLKKLQTGRIDFYLLHGLSKDRWSKVRDLNVCQWAEKAIRDGRIKHLGFSFHDSFDMFKEIIDSSDLWTFCQIQYNYMDSEIQAGTRGVRYAASKGLALVIMEPIKGGWLTVPPPEVQAIWDKSPVKRSAAEWALQWVWDQPEVSVVLSGMSNMQQVVQNVESADRSGVCSLNQEELKLISEAKAKYQSYGFIGCTGCRYCTPCPNGVAIPEVFAMYNEYFRKNESREVAQKYKQMIAEENRASKCIRCGTCETLCPQHLPIRDLLNKAAGAFERT